MVVGAIIRNYDGAFLLQKRDDKAPSYRGHWTLFGGVVEPGESARQAITRELFEEIGLIIFPTERCDMIAEYLQDNGTRQVIFGILIDTPIEKLTLREGAAMEFVKPANLFARNFAFNIEMVLHDYVDGLDLLNAA